MKLSECKGASALYALKGLLLSGRKARRCRVVSSTEARIVELCGRKLSIEKDAQLVTKAYLSMEMGLPFAALPVGKVADGVRNLLASNGEYKELKKAIRRLRNRTYSVVKTAVRSVLRVKAAVANTTVAVIRQREDKGSLNILAYFARKAIKLAKSNPKIVLRETIEAIKNASNLSTLKNLERKAKRLVAAISLFGDTKRRLLEVQG